MSLYKTCGRDDYNGEKDDVLDNIVDSNCLRVYLTDNGNLRATKFILEHSDMRVIVVEKCWKTYVQQNKSKNKFQTSWRDRVTLLRMDIFDAIPYITADKNDVYIWADLEVCELTQKQLEIVAKAHYRTVITLAGGRKRKVTVKKVVEDAISVIGKRVFLIDGYKRRYENGKLGQLMINICMKEKPHNNGIMYGISHVVKRAELYGIKYVGYKDIEWRHPSEFRFKPTIIGDEIKFQRKRIDKTPIKVDLKTNKPSQKRRLIVNYQKETICKRLKVY